MAVQMSVAPSLALLTLIKTREGERIEIIKSVATRWKDIAVLFDFDATGKALQQIEAGRGSEGAESCCRAMFQLWLEGKGAKPVSWATLLKVLEDSLFTALVTQVKATLSCEFQCKCSGMLYSITCPSIAFMVALCIA